MMKFRSTKQKQAHLWRLTPPTLRGYLAGQRSVMALRCGVLHLLPVTALRGDEVEARLMLNLAVATQRQ